MNGELMSAEMNEQPDVVMGLAQRRHEIAERVRSLLPRPSGVVLSARGSSAAAATIGRHALALATARPAMVEPLSLAGYGWAPDFHGWLHVAASQSGRTPEIVSAAAEHAAAGACTIGVTNDPCSPLAAVVDLVLDLDAGPELAVPATKTVVAQIVALLHVAAAYDDSFAFDDATWTRFTDSMRACLDDDAAISPVCAASSSAATLIVTGRGYGFAAAREGALKIKEASCLPAEAVSHTELLHGPIAVAGPATPVIVVRIAGPAAASADRLIIELRRRAVPHWILGDGADADLAVPPGLPEPLSTVLAVIRMQQLARALAEVRGIDADQPNELSKVTYT